MDNKLIEAVAAALREQPRVSAFDGIQTPEEWSRQYARAAILAFLDAAAGDEGVVEKVADATERASCPHREGPFGGYDYGHNNPDPPPKGRYVVRDFRDPRSPDYGKWIHQTNDKELHDAMYRKMTREHIARAALSALKTEVKP